MPKYTYDPNRIYDGGVSQMRFELQDTLVEGEATTTALCDEEYKAIINNEKSWKYAKLRCLKAIVTKFAYEVNTNTNGLSYSLNERYPRWKAMYEEVKKETIVATPRFNSQALASPSNPMYFRTDMHVNNRKR